MRGLDPRICRVKEDGRIKSGHDVVGDSEAGFGVRRNGKTSGGDKFLLHLGKKLGVGGDHIASRHRIAALDVD